MRKTRTIFLLLIIVFLLSGCANEGQKLMFTHEELGEIAALPEYKIWIGDNYLKLEKQNQAEHLVPGELLRIAFSEDFPEISDDGIPRYVKPAMLEKLSQINVKIDGNILEIAKVDSKSKENYGYVNLNWQEPVGYVFLVNKEYPLNDDYEDQSLREIKSPYLQPIYNNMRLAEEAYINLERMSEDFYKDNKAVMVLVSTYRDFDHQNRLFTNRIASNKAKYGLNYEDAYKKASEIIAIPGTSEHQSGLAIDFSSIKMIQKGRTLVNDFSEEKEGKWLFNKGKDYGFILRYPKDKTEMTQIVFEPWHYRYVGHPHGEIIYENNWTLEEYLEYLEKETKYLTDEYSVFYLDQEKILGYEVYYYEDIKVENDNKGGWVLSKVNK